MPVITSTGYLEQNMRPFRLPFGVTLYVDFSARPVACPYVSFPFKKYRYEIINQPLKWMSAAGVSKLQLRLQSFSASRLGYVPQFSFFTNADYFKNKVIIICSDRKTDQDYCFGVMYHLGKYNNHKVIHLGPLFSAHENRGLAKLIFVFGIMYTFFNERIVTSMYLTTLTHVPRLSGIFWDYFQNVFPGVDPDIRPKKLHLEIKDMLLRTYLNEWELPHPPQVDDHFIMKGFRKQVDGTILINDTAATVPKHRNPAYNERLISMLDYANGDEMLQVCQVQSIPFFRPLNALVFLRTK